jgi:hypothetical protein
MEHMSGVNGSASLNPPIPMGLLTDNLAGEMEDKLRLHAGELADLEAFNIAARTPIRTGALVSDITEQSNLSDTILAYVYFDSTNQLDEYNRVYVQYQEGGVLGLPTYTNPPRLMVASAVTDDIADIEDWGNSVLQDWVTNDLVGR